MNYKKKDCVAINLILYSLQSVDNLTRKGKREGGQQESQSPIL